MRATHSVVFACLSKVCAPPPVGKGGSLPEGAADSPAPKSKSLPTKGGKPAAHTVSGKDVFVEKNSSDEVFGTQNRNTLRDKAGLTKVSANSAVSSHLAKDEEFVGWVETNGDRVSSGLQGMNRITAHFFAKMGGVFKSTLAEITKQRDPYTTIDNVRLVATVNEMAQAIRVATNNPSLTNAEAIAQIVSRTMIDSWAESSGSMTSAASQIMAAEVHKTPSGDFKKSRYGQARDAMDALRTGAESIVLHRAYIRAEYAVTQQWFKDNGIKSVTVYRGVRDVGTDDERFDAGETVKLESNPLSSWTTDPEVGIQFGSFGASKSRKENSVTLAMEVPVSAIQSVPWVGRGCLDEFEVVLIGKPASAVVFMDEQSA